jgi:acyl carrier protein
VTKEEVIEGIKECLAMAIGIDEDSITGDASIVDDLGADSMDMVDIIFRVEKKFNLKTSASEIQTRLLGGLPENEFFDEKRKVTPAGLEQLKKEFPAKDIDEYGTMDEEGIFSIITVNHLVDMIMEKKTQS